jgi:RNase adapter protein RapZ
MMEKTQEKTDSMELVVITGMSGAGKTVAVQSFEDLGYYCIDNLPPELLLTFLKLLADSDRKQRRVAAVMDMRGREYFDSLTGTLDQIEAAEGFDLQVLFLDADDSTLVKRYKETRRKHPLSHGGLVSDGIRKEREMLSELKGRARYLFNTSYLRPKELREKIVESFSETEKGTFTVNVMSFGYKHGIPIDADIALDVRFLPNPYYIEELKPHTGLQREVYEYVMKQNDTKELILKLEDLFRFLIPRYKEEGKAQLVIAFGCTGGQHRSVSLAEYFAEKLSGEYKTSVTHRDIKHRKG